jgi:hypothetical protein
MSKSMSVAAVKASLEKMGCPVLPGGNWSRSSVFEISGESGKDAPNGLPWASYYCDSPSMPFGVNVLLEEKLAKAGLMAEWINPGVIGVYPN